MDEGRREWSASSGENDQFPGEVWSVLDVSSHPVPAWPLSRELAILAGTGWPFSTELASLRGTKCRTSTIYDIEPVGSPGASESACLDFRCRIL